MDRHAHAVTRLYLLEVQALNTPAGVRVPAGGFRGPLLGSKNVLTTVARGFGVPGGRSAALQGTAAAIGLVTVAIWIYDATIELEGFIYAAKDAPPSNSKCGCGN